MNRRRFVRASCLAGAAGLAGLPAGAGADSLLRRAGPRRDAAGTPFGGAPSGAGPAPEPLLESAGAYRSSVGGASRLVVLHTNDTHSRLDPFPQDGGRFAGLGGAARRAVVVQRVRDDNEHVLLFDSGDVFQGTPYFNYFGGEPEFKVMSAMGYDAATLGNHDFDNGVDGLARVLPHAEFDFVVANYDVAGTPLEERVKPFVIRDMGAFKVGVFGLGIAFERLVLARLHEGVTYLDPVESARRTAEELRNQGCAVVVCLSHLGYRYNDPSRPSDQTIAEKAPGIDLILGGHTHTFLPEPDKRLHGDGRATLVNQVGWAGMRLGRIDVAFDESGSPSGWAAGGYDIDDRLD